MSSGRWEGLLRLAGEAVEQGSRAIERVALESAQRPFAILERLPRIGRASEVVHLLFDASVTSSHGAIRLLNQAAGAALRPIANHLDGESTRGGPERG
jgi:hypothetical protein